jgi:hypothetical protein
MLVIDNLEASRRYGRAFVQPTAQSRIKEIPMMAMGLSGRGLVMGGSFQQSR